MLAAQMVSITFSWCTRFAVPWWIFRVTHSLWMLGVSAFLGQGFSLFVIPWAGALADAIGRRRLYAITQAASLLQVTALACLAWRGEANLHWLLGLCAARGLIFALEQPARDGFLPDLVGPELLRESVTLQSSLTQIGRLAGPVIAGFLILHAGEWACFALDGVSYLPVIALLMRLPRGAEAIEQGGEAAWWKDVASGWRMVRADGDLRCAVLLLALLNLLGLPLLTVLPSFVSEALRRGPEQLSLLAFASALGALAANYTLARVPREENLEYFILPGFLATGFALLATSVAHTAATAAAAMFVSGYAAMAQISATNVRLQKRCEPRLRGRVLAVYGMAFWGVAPFGSLLIGKVAALAGVRMCLFAYGFACLVMGQAVLVWRQALRPLLGGNKWAVAAWKENRYAGL